MSKLHDLEGFDFMIEQFTHCKNDGSRGVYEILQELPYPVKKPLLVELRAHLLLKVGDVIMAARKQLVEEAKEEARETLSRLSDG